MTLNEVLPLAVLASSLLPGLIIFTLPEAWVGTRTTLNIFAAVTKIVLVGILLAGVQAGETYGVRFAVLHPAASHYDAPRRKTNDLSCVVRVESDHGSALLTGDIEAASEAELLRGASGALAADVLVVPHHGSRTSSTAPFVAAVAPAAAVFTPGYRNRFGHPGPDVVARYRATGARIWRTDLDGALTFDFAPGAAPTPRTERAQGRRYWRDAPAPEAATSAD